MTKKYLQVTTSEELTAAMAAISTEMGRRAKAEKTTENGESLGKKEVSLDTECRATWEVPYAAGELKHGTISLVEDNTLVIGVLTQSSLFEKTLSNMLECKSRGAYLMGLTTNGNFSVEDSVNFTVYVPKTDEHFIASLAIVPLQLLGYYTSVNRGLDVDKPRNLAKSVTVE